MFRLANLRMFVPRAGDNSFVFARDKTRAWQKQVTLPLVAFVGSVSTSSSSSSGQVIVRVETRLRCVVTPATGERDLGVMLYSTDIHMVIPGRQP
jgi:hypothetical protein